MYKAEKENERKERQEKLELDTKQKQEQQQEMIKQNQSKVSQRQQDHLTTLGMRIETVQQKTVAQQVRQQKLDEAVEKYSFRPQMEIDSNRVVQETETRMIRKETTLDKADKVKLYKEHGYNIDNLMKDIRFKVNAALTEANLAGTSYGK